MNADILETIKDRIGISDLDSVASLIREYATPTQTPTIRPQVSKNRKYERGYPGNYQR